jgi:hypothetical protein
VRAAGPQRRADPVACVPGRPVDVLGEVVAVERRAERVGGQRDAEALRGEQRARRGVVQGSSRTVGARARVGCAEQRRAAPARARRRRISPIEMPSSSA